MDTDAILDKIQKLKALADGTKNPHEAAVALAKLQKLLTDNALTLDSVPADHLDRGEIVDLFYSNKDDVGNIPQWMRRLIAAVTEINLCEWYSEVVDFKFNETTQAHYSAGRSARTTYRRALRIVGRKTGVDNSIYMLNNVVGQLERMLATLEIPPGKNTKQYKTSWLYGAATTIAEYLVSEFRKDVAQNPNLNALVVSRNGEIVKYFDALGVRRMKRVTVRLSATAFNAGKLAGKEIKIQGAAPAGINSVGYLE